MTTETIFPSPKDYWFPILNNKNSIIAIIIATLIFIGTCINLEPAFDESALTNIITLFNFQGSLSYLSIFPFIVIFLITRVFISTAKEFFRFDIPTIFIALFFGFAMVFGKTCDIYSNPLILFQGTFQIIKLFYALISFSVLAIIIIYSLSVFLDNYRTDSSSRKTRLTKVLEKHSILFPSLLVAICWLPLLISFYPGILAPGDTLNQIRQVFGLSDATSASIVLIDQNMLINQHHPVFHTFIMGGGNLARVHLISLRPIRLFYLYRFSVSYSLFNHWLWI